IESYDVNKGKLFTWMMNIARNAAIDMLRSKAYRQQGQNHELTELVYNVASTGAKNTDLIGLRKIVHMLDEDYKSLVDLAYFQGFTQDEISKMLNIPLGTVKTRLRNALIKLRSML
ncbi:MAG TPA: sigma-70 family RNA polymerase sigma factor, partial [Chitinophagaceae bacterium]|nr:sigma-70 family RNA polymerase sigma factor [Chitinophagaceae bacterium]